MIRIERLNVFNKKHTINCDYDDEARAGYEIVLDNSERVYMCRKCLLKLKKQLDDVVEML